MKRGKCHVYGCKTPYEYKYRVPHYVAHFSCHDVLKYTPNYRTVRLCKEHNQVFKLGKEE